MRHYDRFTRIIWMLAVALLSAAPGRAQDTTALPDTVPVADTASAGDLRFTSITAGASHSCGLTADSSAYCWGRNEFGQLGDSTTSDRAAPVPVSGGMRFAALSAGERHTCGIDADGYPYCWGANNVGQSGTGLGSDRPYPTRVAGRHRMKLIGAGAQHTCATITHWEQEERMFCWGHNSDGQLGNRELRNSGTPAPAFGAVRYTSLAVGERHTCAVTAAGTVNCWGANDRGQLGNGSVTNSNVPFPIRASRRAKFTGVAVGSAHSCAFTQDGEVHCWGDNSAGQLGTGKGGKTAIMPQRLDRSVRFSALSAGGETTCGLRPDGKAFCWGSNAAGQFGIRATPGSREPVEVLPEMTLTAIAVGREHACGVADDGSAYCWGTGSAAHLGGGAPSSGPVKVSAQP